LNEYLHVRLAKIKAWIDENNPGDLLIPMSAALEYRLSTLETNEEREALLKSLETQSALPRIIIAGYQVLQLIYFFTCGPDEVKAWTIRRATKAPQAAGVPGTIHFQIKAAGRYLQKGKDYVVEDGDILYIRAGLANKK
ncbi:9033_t:CDS:2, partial [Gigaspora rosea]